MKTRYLLLAGLLASLAGAPLAQAADRSDGDRDHGGGRRGAMAMPQSQNRPGAYSSPITSLGEVIGALERRSPGRQLDSGLEHMGGREVYRVRWLTQDGRRIVDSLVDFAFRAFGQR